jgi:ATP-dependent DNA helicase RecG
VTLEPSPFDLAELASSLTALTGVGPATARALAARGVRTWGDALFFLPLRYEDRRRPTPLAKLEPGRLAVVRGRVASSGPLGKKGKVWRVVLEEGPARLSLVWFRFQRARLEALAPGEELFAVGEVAQAPRGGLQMAHPEVYPAREVGPDHPAVGRVLPVYPSLEAARPANVRKFMAELALRTTGRIADPLYGVLPRRLYPLPAGSALRFAHLPPAEAGPEDLDPKRAPWRQSLAVNELLHFELALALKRRRREASPARPLAGEGRRLAEFVESLPFRLTPGQEAAVEALRADLARSRPMGRLLMGDVGTGKTVVAAAAAVMAAEAGARTALMAPTEVLARQHAATLARLLEPAGLAVGLVTASQEPAARGRAAEAEVVVGTHALIARGAELEGLGLAVIDEQHRFGVHQRLRLAGGGKSPHLLVLSATPIPRTLALALAGHLEVSDLPERPLAPRPVETEVVPHHQRRRAVEEVGRALERGEQVYVICPLVEPSSSLEAQDVVTTHQNLAAYFPRARVGLLHGRMEADEQERVLAEFGSGGLQALCATTVVEVGVDVPAATLMVVLAAERFGLSQLHQLRGRVGRGERPGRCLLVPGPEPGELGQKRLEALAATSDGKKVAEADLRLRGPGEFLGQRQSGLPPFRVADWARDAELVPQLREIIASWLAGDPRLGRPPLAEVKAEALRRWGRRLGLAQAG